MPSAFEGLAASYERWRPRYPSEALDPLVTERTADRTPKLLVDVGTGTGISARLLREAFGPEPEIVAIDPEDDMLAQARKATPAKSRISYLHGQAECLPFADGSASLLLAAQAYQWFDRRCFLAEARRALGTGDILAVLQNDRDWQQGGVAAAYEEFLEAHSPGYTRHYRSFDVAEELESGGFHHPRLAELCWARHLEPTEFIEMALTSSKTQAAVDAIGEGAVKSELRAIAGSGNMILLPYVTRLYWARNPEA
jgi:ubiquinone/menaquinone biosynthesis C-methylase UbiE